MRILKLLIVALIALQADPCLRFGAGLRACLIFGYDAARDGCLSAQTKSRCDKAIEIFRQGKIDQIYITAAGMGQNECVADEMANYLSKQGINRSLIIVSRGGYNTAGEIDAFLEIAPKNCQIVAVSSNYHLLRIKLLFSTRGWFCQTYGSSGGVYPIEELYEIPKTILNLFLPRMFVERVH